MNKYFYIRNWNLKKFIEDVSLGIGRTTFQMETQFYGFTITVFNHLILDNLK